MSFDNYNISKAIIANKQIEREVEKLKKLPLINVSDVIKEKIKTINPEREIADNLKDKVVTLYHKYKGEVRCFIKFESEQVEVYKFTLVSNKIKKHKYYMPYLFTDPELTNRFLSSSKQPETIEKIIFDDEKLAQRKAKEEDVREIYNKIENIFNCSYRNITYHFNNGKSTDLVFRKIKLTRDTMEVIYSAPKSDYRTRRIFEFKL